MVKKKPNSWSDFPISSLILSPLTSLTFPSLPSHVGQVKGVIRMIGLVYLLFSNHSLLWILILGVVGEYEEFLMTILGLSSYFMS